jgi:hypothetical protein
MYWSDQRKENEAMHHEIRRTLDSKPSVLKTVVEKTGAADQVRTQFANYEEFASKLPTPVNKGFGALVDALIAECEEAELVFGPKNPLNLHSEAIREIINQHTGVE